MEMAGLRWMWRCLVKLKMIMYVFGWFLHQEGLLVVCTSIFGWFLHQEATLQTQSLPYKELWAFAQNLVYLFETPPWGPVY